jgi:hypothetical protein
LIKLQLENGKLNESNKKRVLSQKTAQFIVFVELDVVINAR